MAAIDENHYRPGRLFPAALRASPAVLVLGAILLLVILPPLIFLLVASVHTTNYDGSFDQLTFRYFADLVGSATFFRALGNTAIYATGAAVVGIVLGVVVERTNTPGRKYVFLGAVISLAIPHVLYVVAWLLIVARAGPVNQFFAMLLGDGTFVIDVYSLPGMILIEGVSFVPLTFLMMSAVLRVTDAAFEEASMMSGANAVTTFWRITLRMGMPGVLALLLLSFIRAFESFEVPAIVGLAGGIEVLTTNIYQSTQAAMPPNFGQAGAHSVFLLCALSVLLFFYSQVSKHAHKYQTITGRAYRPRVIDLGRMRWFGTLLVVGILFLVIGMPLLIILFASLQPFYGRFSFEVLDRMTLSNYAKVIGPGFFRDTFVKNADPRHRNGKHRGSLHRALRLAGGAAQGRGLGAGPACHGAADLSVDRDGRGLPARLRQPATGEAGACQNIVQGHVRNRLFLGEIAEYVINLKGDQEVLVRAHPSLRLVEGQAVQVVMPPERIVAIG